MKTDNTETTERNKYVLDSYLIKQMFYRNYDLLVAQNNCYLITMSHWPYGFPYHYSRNRARSTFM